MSHPAYVAAHTEGNLPAPLDDRAHTHWLRVYLRTLEDRCDDRAEIELREQMGNDYGDQPLREVAAAYDAIRDELWEAQYANPPY